MPEDRQWVPFTYTFCRRCAGRVELGRVAFGDQVECPRCGYVFFLRHPDRERDGAGQGGASRSPPVRDRAGQGAGAHARADFPDELPPAWSPPRHRPPWRVFLSGTFVFPLYLTSLPRTVVLAAASVALVAAAWVAAYCLGADHERLDRSTRVMLENGLLLSSAMGAVALPFWIWLASAFGMTILRETTNGAGAVKDWPRLYAFEGLGETPFVVVAGAAAFLPGALLVPVWHRLGVPPACGACAVTLLLFPITLFSMLETGSPVRIVSLTVWQSLFFGWRAWMVFHLTTFAEVIAVAGIGWLLWRRAQGAWSVGAAGLLLAFAWMVYFRLLGRLAWFGTHRSEEESGGA